jgi:hypothetical protein
MLLLSGPVQRMCMNLTNESQLTKDSTIFFLYELSVGKSWTDISSYTFVAAWARDTWAGLEFMVTLMPLLCLVQALSDYIAINELHKQPVGLERGLSIHSVDISNCIV